MGLQHQAQPRLILNLVKSGLKQVTDNKFDITFIDHMLCCHSMTSAAVLDVPREQGIVMIATVFANYYQNLGIGTEYLVLCCDEIKCPKPAVRQARERAPTLAPIAFTLKNLRAINIKMMEILRTRTQMYENGDLEDHTPTSELPSDPLCAETAPSSTSAADTDNSDDVGFELVVTPKKRKKNNNTSSNSGHSSPTIGGYQVYIPKAQIVPVSPQQAANKSIKEEESPAANSQIDVGDQAAAVTPGAKRPYQQVYVPPKKRNPDYMPFNRKANKIPKIVLMSGPETWMKMDTCTVRATSFDGDHPFTANILRSCYCESDIYMFDIAERLQISGFKCAIMSKDSDVLGTMCMRAPNKNNPLTVLFQTNQFNFTKDFDSMFPHRIEAVIPVVENSAARSEYMKGFGTDKLAMLFDVTDLHLYPALGESADSFVKYLKKNNFTDDDVDKVYEYFANIGFRGALFRRFVARCHVDRSKDNDSAANILRYLALKPDIKYSLKMITRVLVKKLFSECFSAFTVHTDKTTRTTVDQDGLSVVTETGFRTQPHTIIQKVPGADDIDALTGHRVTIMKAYASGLFRPNTYGEYLMFNLRNTQGVVRLQINQAIPNSVVKAAGMMAIMSGTDYNFLIPKLGRTHLMRMWASPEWEHMTTSLINKTTYQLKDNLGKSTGSAWTKEFMRIAGASTKTVETTTNEMLWCVERTALFVYELWAGEGLSDFGYYGLRIERDGLVFDMTTTPICQTQKKTQREAGDDDDGDNGSAPTSSPTIPFDLSDVECH